MDSLGDRIKRYEEVYQPKLTPRSCLFIRVDGKSFHTFTKSLPRPFSDAFIDAMMLSARELAQEIQGFKLAYIQSDEATFMITDFDTLQTQGWFGYELNKVVSISASIMTAHFNSFFQIGKQKAYFDSRAFIVPVDDWANVFIWRQRDWERNSIQMYARAIFNQKQLHNKSIPEIHEMLHQEGLNWANLSDTLKNGTFILQDYQIKHFKATYEQLNDLVELETNY